MKSEHRFLLVTVPPMIFAVAYLAAAFPDYFTGAIVRSLVILAHVALPLYAIHAFLSDGVEFTDDREPPRLKGFSEPVELRVFRRVPR